MPPAQWPEPVAVVERLLDSPHGFEFFQAVRLLERWWAREEGLSRTQVLATRLGFRNSLAMSFPASEIESLRATWQELKDAVQGSDAEPADVSRRLERVELTPAFMGLLGVGGALPSYYTELISRREIYQRDGAARAFLDIFLHRAVALFYQAWRKHRLALQFESDRRHQFLPLMLSVAGIGHKSLRQRLRALDGGVADDTLAHLAGVLQCRPVSAQVLQTVLAYYFRIPVKLEQFVGRWFTLPRANQSHLGLANMALGKTAVVGERVWQRDLRLRLTLGPLNGERFKRFLPGGSGALALKELLALLSGPTLEYEVRLALKSEDLRGIALDNARGVCLGWDSYLVTHAKGPQGAQGPQGSQDSQGSIRTDAGYDLLALA